jgi:hypothetical protein
MRNTLSPDCLDENREDDEGPTLMLPGNVHGFSDPAKKLLTRLSSITGWWDLQEIMEGRGKRRPCFLFHRIVETETESVYEYRANEGTVIRAKIPKGMYYKRTQATTDARGTWVAGIEISCSVLLINFVYKHAARFPEFQEKNANEGNSSRLFLKETPLIGSQTRWEENLLPESRTSTSQQDITIECPGLGARPKPSQQSDIVVGNFGREGKKRYGLGQGIVPIDESQRGRINELDLNGLITVFHSERVKQIWEDLFPTARGVFPSQFILPIPEHLMAVDTSALICMLITIQMMRDVKTTCRVDDGTHGDPEADPTGDHPRESGDSGLVRY